MIQRQWIHVVAITAIAASATVGVVGVQATRVTAHLLRNSIRQPFSSVSHPRFGLSPNQRRGLNPSVVLLLRGGDRDDSEDDSDTSESYSESDTSSDESFTDDDDDDETVAIPPPTAAASSSGPPVALTIRTSLGSRLLDQSVELPTVNRNRDIASVKQSVSRQLAARPPVETMQLSYQGRVLSDTVLVDTLVDDDDDEEEEDEDDEMSAGLVLQLDMIPAVDPKFVADLEKKIADMTAAELLEAYAINEASVYQSAALLMHEMVNEEKTLEADDDDSDDDSDNESERESTHRAKSMTLQIREHGARIRTDWEVSLLQSDSAKALLAETESPSTKKISPLEIKGHRVRRTGVAGVKGSWKLVLQRNLNVDWGDTIRNFLLFLFFGYFGGRTAMSRAILLLGAPSVFVLQLRPVKHLLRQTIYALFDHPPSIVLSLLPAPQQAILSMNSREALKTVYGDSIVSVKSTLPADESSESDIDSSDNGDRDDSDDIPSMGDDLVEDDSDNEDSDGNMFYHSEDDDY